MEKLLAYHFTNGMRLRDGQELIEGKTYIHKGPIEICSSGLHASRRVIDALRYAPNGTLSIVECSGIEEEHDDKFVCRERKVLETHDVTRLLQDFALDVAEEAIEKYWKVVGDRRPQDAIRIARLYLEGKATTKELKEARNTMIDSSIDYGNRYTYNQLARAVQKATEESFYTYESLSSTAAVIAHAHAYDEFKSNKFTDNYVKTISEFNSQLTKRLQKLFKNKIN